MNCAPSLNCATGSLHRQTDDIFRGKKDIEPLTGLLRGPIQFFLCRSFTIYGNSLSFKVQVGDFETHIPFVRDSKFRTASFPNPIRLRTKSGIK